MRQRLSVAVLLLCSSAPALLSSQSFPTSDPIIRRIWSLGMDSSQTPVLAQTLLDSLGPRLTGSPQFVASAEWTIDKLAGWGISAKKAQYGTWRGWDRGHTHLDLVSPRIRSLEAMMLSWSPGTGGKNVEGETILLPYFQSRTEFQEWLDKGGVRGRFVMISFPQPTCRPDSDWKEWSAQGTFDRMDTARKSAESAWEDRLKRIGLSKNELPRSLEAAGAVGILTNYWSKGWGVDKIFNARTNTIPTLNVSCEDYGLLARLAENKQGPRVRLNAQSQDLGEVPVFNIIGEIKGTEKPDEYVVLSAHFDSWDGASGATDNGTGVVTMMEVARILKATYPNPKRSIIFALWSGEEQGLNGSRAFAADRPEVVKGMHALFNQDNGTGRIKYISTQGLVDAGQFFGRWFGRIPDVLTREIEMIIPGQPGSGGSDHASFVCAGAPAFMLSSLSWHYGTYTWHTNRDTYDKISFDDVKSNATLIAMLTYLASEDSETIPRTLREMKSGWPRCGQSARSSGANTR